MNIHSICCKLHFISYLECSNKHNFSIKTKESLDEQNKKLASLSKLLFYYSKVKFGEIL